MQNGVPDILTDEVQRVPIDKVREHPENPRDGDVAAIQKRTTAGAIGLLNTLLIPAWNPEKRVQCKLLPSN